MAIPCARLLLAAAVLATVGCVGAAHGSAWVDDVRARAPVRTDLIQWHTGLPVALGSPSRMQWENVLATTDPDEVSAYVVMHHAFCLWGAAGGSFEPATGIRHAAHVPAAEEGASVQKAH